MSLTMPESQAKASPRSAKKEPTVRAIPATPRLRHAKKVTTQSAITVIVATTIPAVYNRGMRWTEEEQENLIEVCRANPLRSWKEIAAMVGTRTERQVISHWQKLKEKIERHKRGLHPNSKANRALRAFLATFTAEELKTLFGKDDDDIFSSQCDSDMKALTSDLDDNLRCSTQNIDPSCREHDSEMPMGGFQALLLGVTDSETEALADDGAESPNTLSYGSGYDSGYNEGSDSQQDDDDDDDDAEMDMNLCDIVAYLPPVSTCHDDGYYTDVLLSALDDLVIDGSDPALQLPSGVPFEVESANTLGILDCQPDSVMDGQTFGFELPAVVLTHLEDVTPTKSGNSCGGGGISLYSAVAAAGVGSTSDPTDLEALLVKLYF